MDVERLMRDLTVEQLENIHTSLQKEMEQKKEELREMVGRRYRDVLEASTQVRETHARAASLAECVSKARSSGHAETPRAPRDETRALLGFIALQRLLPAVGAENEGADALSDVFALLLAEQIHRQLMTEQNAAVVSLVVHGLSTRLSRLRRWLVESLHAELCELSRPDWVSVQLAALAILLNQSLEQLLESYLDARKKHISALLQGESSLLTVVEEIKFTLQVVDRLFVRGDLSSVLQAASAIGYRPALLETIVCDQTFAFHSYLNAEIEKINRTQRDRKLVPLTTQKISDKCTLWMDAVCDMATSSVATICAFYDSPQAVLEFLRALAIVMNQEWPRAASCTALYQKMFGTAVLDKFKALVCADAAELSNKLSTGLSETPLAPPPLFEKRSTNQYDPILATGISKPLQSHVLSFFNGVHALRDLCMQYEKAGLETDASSAREALAAAVAEQLIQLGSTVSCPLSKARLCLAALQADPVLACQSLNKDAHHIQRCSKALSQTAEDGLSAHVCGLVSEAMSEEAFQAYISATSDPLKALELSSEWEQVDLPDVGRLQVPVAPTASLCAPILALCRIISSTSLTHLLSRNVRRNLATAVSERLIPVLQRVISTDSTFAQRINIQILFDAKVLITVLPCEGMRSILPAIESRIDPFELAVLAQPMSNNVRLAASRAQLLWACLLPDMMPLRDTTLSPSFIAVSDVVARPKDHPQRIPAIPRLDRAIGEDGLKRMRSRDTRNNKLLAGADARVKGSGTSLTSLYERVTGGWFGN